MRPYIYSDIFNVVIQDLKIDKLREYIILVTVSLWH